MTELRFYLDENMQTDIAEQLVRSGIDAVSVRDLDLRGDTDVNHLQRATAMGRVLCTHDRDFLRMHARGVEHAGIAFGDHWDSRIGGWVLELRRIHAETSAEDARGQVFFLRVR